MLCDALVDWSTSEGLSERSLHMMEAGLGELGILEEKIRAVQSEIGALADRISAVAQMEWESEAGSAFREKTVRTSERTVELSEVAGEAAQLAASGLAEMQNSIASAREKISDMKTATAGAAVGLGVC